MERERAQAIRLLSQANRLRINPSLANLRSFLEETHLDAIPYDTIQIVGTNGKTSTAVMTAAILSRLVGLDVCGGTRGGDAITSDGARVGLFISPHVVHYGERIALDGRSLSEDEFDRLIVEFFDRYHAEIEQFALTEFEILTALAHWHFARAHVQAVVYEAGVGGRLDATTLVSEGGREVNWNSGHPDASSSDCAPAHHVRLGALTSVGFDHMDLLGNTLDEIAYEKLAGFLNRRVILADSVVGPARTAAIEAAVRARVTLDKPIVKVEYYEQLDDGLRATLTSPAGSVRVRLSLSGEMFAFNAALAASIAWSYAAKRADREGRTFEPEAVLEAILALESVRVRARFEELSVKDLRASECVDRVGHDRTDETRKPTAGRKSARSPAAQEELRELRDAKFSAGHTDREYSGEPGNLAGHERHRVIVDGSHNPQAVSEFVKTLSARYPRANPVFVFSFLKDKDGAAMLRAITEGAKDGARIIVVPLEGVGARSLSREEAQDFAVEHGVGFAASFEEAIRQAAQATEASQMAAANKGSCVIAVTGSLYLAGAFLRWVGDAGADSFTYYR